MASGERIIVKYVEKVWKDDLGELLSTDICGTID